VETVYVFAKVDHFRTNKSISSINQKTGQKFYGYVDNFVEAPCSDPGTRQYHKTTYSTDLVQQLIRLYFPKESTILDPFCGTGTTGVACKELGLHYIMIDIDPKYVAFSKKRTSIKERKKKRKRD
jgi:DNA modification methylase